MLLKLSVPKEIVDVSDLFEWSYKFFSVSSVDTWKTTVVIPYIARSKMSYL